MTEDSLIPYKDQPHLDDGVHQPYTAFNQGYDAAERGIALSRNPYDRDSREWFWWLDGHKTSEDQRMLREE